MDFDMSDENGYDTNFGELPSESVGPAPTFEELVRGELLDIKFQLGGMGARLNSFETTLNALKDGVNTIGQMANDMVQSVSAVVAQVQQGGLGSLLSGAMKGKKDA